MSNNHTSDDAFEAYVQKNQAEVESKNQRKVNFVQKFYTNLPKASEKNGQAMKLVRFRGGPPDRNDTPYTARTLQQARIRDDNNKLMDFKMPAFDRDHVYWRFINTVLEKEGDKYVNKEKLSEEAFNRVRYGVAQPNTNQYKYEKGMRGREWLVANVIDREMMDVHREEKHTAILCKDISVSKKNPEFVFPDPGVPSYGFIQPLVQSLFKPYKNWENYDIGIFRLGQKEMPYRLINASLYLPEVPEYLQGLVSTTPLTQEELSWEMYDLAKLCAPTSFKVFLKRQGQLLAEIDNYLGTNFFEEIDRLAQEEAPSDDEDTDAEDWDTEEDSFKESVPDEKDSAVTYESKVRQVPTRGKKEEKPLEGSNKVEDYKAQLPEHIFTKEQLDLIIDVENGLPKFSAPIEDLAACGECGAVSPMSFTHCPNLVCLHEFKV